MTVQKDPERNETKYLHRLANFPGNRVLELGCGDGRLTWRYAARAARVTGIDLDRDGLRVASVDRPSDMEHVALFAQADSTRLPFREGTFDIAIFAWSF